MTGITVEAPAKVNLYLHVVGRRPDGYHLLDSLVAFAEIGDTLELAPASTLSLEVVGPTAALLPPGDDNIVLKAARALAAEAGITAGARIRLTKLLPVAAGIGGGSADAAAALTGLSQLWGVALPPERMRAVALALGADVPVCLAGRPTLMAGIGDRLSPASALPPAWLVLVNPMVALSTPAVFKARTGGFSTSTPLDASPGDAAALAVLLAARRNDLTEAAMSLVPEIGAALDLLAAQPDCLLARMSGSGATCFALFARQAAAQAAAQAMTTARPTWWNAAARLLPPRA
jgi:4-diphosphocytidyl-2-C-methyl-D-erythritol kinase